MGGGGVVEGCKNTGEGRGRNGERRGRKFFKKIKTLIFIAGWTTAQPQAYPSKK